MKLIIAAIFMSALGLCLALPSADLKELLAAAIQEDEGPQLSSNIQKNMNMKDLMSALATSQDQDEYANAEEIMRALADIQDDDGPAKMRTKLAHVQWRWVRKALGTAHRWLGKR